MNGTRHKFCKKRADNMTTNRKFQGPLSKQPLRSVLVKLSVCCVLFLFFSAAGTSTLKAQTGQQAVPFLTIEPDARSAALGNTGVTRKGGFSGFWNPAILSLQERGVLALSHSNWLPGLGPRFLHDYLTVALPLGDRFGVAVDVNYFNLGEQMAMSDQAIPLGTFGNYELAAGTSVGYRITSRWSLGMGMRYIHSNLAAGQLSDNSQIEAGQSLALDFGALYRSPGIQTGRHESILRAGAALSNMGSGISYLEGQQPHGLPSTLRFGWSWQMNLNAQSIHKFVLSHDLSKGLARVEEQVNGADTTWTSVSGFRVLTDTWQAVQTPYGSLSSLQQLRTGVGLEYWYSDMLALRTGYYYEHPYNGDRQFLTMGLGLRYDRFAADFSYWAAMAEHHPGANTLRFTLKVQFGDKRSVSRPQHRVRMPDPDPVPPVMPERPEIPVHEEVPPPEPEESEQPEADPEPIQEPEPETEPEPVPVPEVQPIDWITEYGVSFAEFLNGELRNFPLMSSELSQVHREAASEVADSLQMHENVYLTISGHADRPGDDPVNMLVSEARARAFWLEAVRNGADPNRMHVNALGSSELAENGDYQPRARRVSVKFSYDATKKVEPLPSERESLAYVEQGTLMSGRAFVFEWLSFAKPAEALEHIASIVDFMNIHSGKRLRIVHEARLPEAGEAFLDELVKARTEKIKSLLITYGVNHERISLQRRGDDTWLELVAPESIQPEIAEETIVIVVQ